MFHTLESRCILLPSLREPNTRAGRFTRRDPRILYGVEASKDAHPTSGLLGIRGGLGGLVRAAQGDENDSKCVR